MSSSIKAKLSLSSKISMHFNIHSIVLKTPHEGPFNRLAVWFQGCNIHCKDCCNPEMIPFERKHIITKFELLKIIKEAKDKYAIEGVTLLGGEPTLQKGLEDLCRDIQSLGLGVILYTGKPYSTLNSSLIEHVDLVVDSPFDTTNRDAKRKNIGSSNQIIHTVSARYKEHVSWFENTIKSGTYDVFDNAIHYNGDLVIKN